MMSEHLFYMFRVESQKERAVSRILRSRGYHAIVPMRTTKRRAKSSGSGKRQPAYAVAAPGYVFVARDRHKPDLHEMFRFRAIRSVVGFCGQPAGIEASIMGDWCAHLGKPEKPDDERFKPGDQVQLTRGVFDGFPAVIESIRGGVASVIVQLFGRPTEAKVAIEHIVLPGSSTKISAGRNKVLPFRSNHVNHDRNPRQVSQSRPEAGRKRRSA
ncbi:transcription termination/antitermination protein NusG [Hyphomicrobium sulfonivorans]|uniref:transcription termination/antitermination protein NusG n=1 Tax=Hyphomicrobium sulfonivorans TaxID=121290 RepID=UPI000B0C1E44|nr:transcription termination/antitermination NusG family protein [Hyphomicrobium sulfonivorans]